MDKKVIGWQVPTDYFFIFGQQCFVAIFSKEGEITPKHLTKISSFSTHGVIQEILIRQTDSIFKFCAIFPS